MQKILEQTQDKIKRIEYNFFEEQCKQNSFIISFAIKTERL